MKYIVEWYLKNKTYLKIRRIAKKLVSYGYKRTVSGNYHISFEDAAKICKVNLDFIEYWKGEIASVINTDKRILSETWIDEDFDMNFVGDYDD